ncbi:hypothetical protein X975_20203, partial [Stegodyphus mimosarum]
MIAVYGLLNPIFFHRKNLYHLKCCFKNLHYNKKTSERVKSNTSLHKKHSFRIFKITGSILVSIFSYKANDIR